MVAVPPRLNSVLSRPALLRAVALSVCVLMLPAAAQAQGQLNFFKNYFHNGGHYAQGVSLRGTGTGGFAEATITIAADPNGVTGLPPNADVLVVLLYWETVTNSSGNGTAGAEFNGHSISAGAKFLNPAGTPPCWSNGGATGGGSSAHQMKAYRADVAPFVPHDPATGKRQYIGPHTVRLPDSGTGNSVPSTAGATLLFIYSIPGNQTLKSTVIYDGGVALNQSNQTHMLTMGGWYQASLSNPNAYMTQIVGNGQSNFGELVTFNGGAGIDTFTNPFTGQSGTVPVQPGVWDTFTTAVTLNPGTASATVTTSRSSGNGSFDCLTWGAIILTNGVEDNEKDNIVDVLESSSTSGTITDPTTGEKVPDLYAMGARTWNKDIFIEIGFMKSKSGYGPNALGQTIAAGHTHLPDLDALKMVVTSFNAQGFKLHIDAGNQYPKDWTAANWAKCFQQNNPTWTADCAIIPAIVPGTGTNPNNPPINLADGGEYIEETPCSLSTEASCLFQDYPGPVRCSAVPAQQLNFACRFTGVPGTVIWKSGFRYYRDEPLTHRIVAGGLDMGPNEAACIIAETDGSPGTVCKRRFARNRYDWFRYSLWVHATGIPRDPPNQETPRNVSGIGDFLGADHQVSLGLWDFARGLTFTQASTFMHELGHGLGLRHGGITGELNCKPNYQSIMNYLFQIRGLINDLTGVAEIGYSNQVLKALEEGNLNESLGLKTIDNQAMQWRTRWYTDWQNSFIDNAGGLNITPVAKRCNGAPRANEIMARVDGTSTIGGIDWNANGVITGAIPPVMSDLNFSGLPLTSLAQGTNDWQIINLLTVGSRRNVGGWSVESGYWDTGYWDTGSDTGYWDTGYWDTGAPGDLDFDSGYWDTGYWDTGYWDTGYWDTGAESESALVPKGEIDLDTAASLGNAPNAVKVAIPQGGKDPVVSWLPPHVKSDKVGSYEVYRVEGQTITEANFLNRATINNNIPANQLSVVDTTAKNNVWYIYIVLAQFTEISPITGQAVRSGIATSLPFRK